MDPLTAKNLIDKTRDDYNLIAEQFASTRKYNWDDLAEAVASLGIKTSEKVADLGCGNGRIYKLVANEQGNYYGLDISAELIKIAKKTLPKSHFVIGDVLNTPYRDNEFNTVLSIATLHHIPSKVARAKAVNEMYRITKPGGKVLVSIWYFWDKSKYLKMLSQSLFTKNNLPPGDFLMPWKIGSGKLITTRYFHAWTRTEMLSTLKKAGFTNIHIFITKRKNKNNLIVTTQKPK